MFSLIVAALLGPPQSQAAVPLREVVYSFSHDQTSEYTTDQAPGDPSSAGGTYQTATTGLAAPPESTTKTAGYRGTMTVDILQVDADSGYLKAEVRESTNAENGRTPFDAIFIVRPDGELARASGSDDPDMDALMPYFATQYFGDHVLDPGTAWTMIQTVDKVEYDTTTTVAGVNGDNITVAATMKAPHGVANGSLTVNSKLVYNAAKLVPISLDVTTIRNGSGDTSSAEQTMHTHFDRVSDTLDKSKP